MTVIGIEPTPCDRPRWQISIDNEDIRYLRQVYSTLDDEQFQRIVERGTEILSNFPDPNGEDRQTTGLVIGKVQSGKTLSFTALTALAASNGYRMIVVLAGTKNALMMQTMQRLERDLGTQQPERISRFLVLSNPTLNHDYLISDTLSPETNGTVLIVCLKHAQHIDDVRTLLSSPGIPQMPTLIIDDEGDEASLNTRANSRRGARAGAPRGESAIYKSIRRLRESIRKHAYVAYTATPQAPLLLPRIDVLSPRFCVMIEPGTGYCGGTVFFSDDTIDRYVRTIDIADVNPTDGRVITSSLRRALSTFFVAGAIRHLRAPHDMHTMLIHITHLTREHTRIRELLLQELSDWGTRLANPENDPARLAVENRFQESYRDLQQTVRNPPPWEQVLARMNRELRKVEVHVVNSLPEAIDAAEARFRRPNNIVIGGNMLGRGVTIQDLTITYITRRARNETNADTMEQRARWFGYKESYLDLCRIYMSNELRRDYAELLRHEDDFWESLQRNLRQGIPIVEWPRFFRLDSAILRPTRTNVARSEQFRSTGWRIMQPSTDQQIRESNLQYIEEFFRGMEHEVLRFGNQFHHVYRNVPVEQVLDGLINRIVGNSRFTGRNKWDTGYVSEFIRRLQFARRLDNIDVVLMRPGDDTNYRTPEDGTNRINPMQGRSPQGDTVYPGDEHILEGRPQLQVHRYSYGRGGPRVCSLALYLPENGQFDLSYIVRTDDL